MYKKNCLLILVLIGTCTAIGDGILTPAISGIQHSSFIGKTDWNLDCDTCLLCSSLCIRWNKSSESEDEYR